MPIPALAIVTSAFLGLLLEEKAHSNKKAEKIIETGFKLSSRKSKKTINKKGGKYGK